MHGTNDKGMPAKKISVYIYGRTFVLRFSRESCLNILTIMQNAPYSEFSKKYGTFFAFKN